MSEKKLYEVTVRFTYYAYAKDRREAESFADEASGAESLHECAEADQVNHPRWNIDEEWGDASLVYHNSGGDITLGEVMAKLPLKAEV